MPLQTHNERSGPRIAFWICGGAGILAMAIAWGWFGFAVYEEYSEQGKALAAGTSMDGFAAVFGGVPLVLAHVIGLILLLILGWYGWRVTGIVFGVAAVSVASIIGLGIAQILFAGQVFGIEETFVP